jgi:diguanylate cyclase (GGDEF)-like protein
VVGRKHHTSAPETSSGALVSSLPANASAIAAGVVAPIVAAVRVPAARLRAVARVHRYVAVIAVPGTLLLAWQVRRAMLVGQQWSLATLGLFAAFVVLGEFRPIRLSRRDEEEEILTSTTFTFALLLSSGLAAAVVVRALVCALPTLMGRKPLWKSTFNAAQYTIALVLANASLRLLSNVPRPGHAHFLTADLPAILVAAIIYFAVNNALTGTALALAQDAPVLAYLRHDFVFQASTAGVLLALAPIVVVCSERSLLMVPLFALPMGAVYTSASMAHDKHQALHDALTNLPNRRLFRDRVNQAVVSARRSRTPVAVMLLDLDRFKEVNDTLGHHIGDLLLQQVATRLQETLREGDTIARLGGDEYAVLLPVVSGATAAEAVAEKLVQALETPFTIRSWTFDIDASIGIAVSPEHGDTVDALMQRADVAMYVAKEGRTGFELYSADRDRHSPRRLALLGDLRRAIDDHNSLVLHYQPKADMRTGGIRGVEALLRWNHPEHGTIPPDEFIPLAEHTGLIRPVTLFVLDEALAQCRRWNDSGVRVGMAVNLSVRNLYDPSFADEVAGLLRKWQVPASQLELEITESVIMADPMRAMAVLARLSELGVGLSLDDFGVGYSSLAYLKRLPVTEIKIDKSFVMNISHDESDAMIVRSTIGLARSLGMRVVAEGVETEATWTRLVSLGCDVAQGFYLCRPKPAEELTAWLATAKISPADGSDDAEWISPEEASGKAPSLQEVVRRLGASGVVSGE